MSDLHHDESHKQHDDDTARDLMSRLTGWLIPALVGALLTLLFNASGERVSIEQLALRVQTVELSLREMSKDLASGGPPALSRRVDDLQKQTQDQYRDVSDKLDVIQDLLIKRQ